MLQGEVSDHTDLFCVSERSALAQAKPVVPLEQELSNDPDNVPPRSRLFIVVPKQAEPQNIQVRWRSNRFLALASPR